MIMRTLLKVLFVPIIVLGVGAASCHPQQDVRQEHLYACEAYTSALRKINVWKDAGRLSANQQNALRDVAESTTPLCMTETPTASANMLITQAAAQLEELSARILLEETE